MAVEVPFKWNVVAYYAECDTDNLRISDDFTYILTQYIVDGVILEGSCYDEMKNPASGVMLQLTNYGMTEIVSDTVVMNNRGYWQLRGNMGVYEVSVSKDSPGKALVSENGTLWLTKPVGERINL
ncbi:hypothetical protein JH06_0778 [Blastocystis sp. subtype 4]|uniref:hypothetical protein n=1 Tax=Blastocystis sp. subtype 4 TaxID=944170 RepID=UPI0007113963|nr:hypothetical protein JH06_0778 [Blastocystis sp. subtype 4]KNB46685.1 hypothetical protein JH06_0778 [Blastocystis sp. subtype 4]|eukprot:XP_014530117.1 hypothetical protein JH06_0778 [Blastocystis sp. subtype 4]